MPSPGVGPFDTPQLLSRRSGVDPDAAIGSWRKRLFAIVATVAMIASLTFAAPPAAAAPEFTFDGGGWGHGVGMSQYGAKGFADAGRTTRQILSHYYQGTSVVTEPQPRNMRIHLVDTTSIRLSAASNMTLQVPLGQNRPISVGSEVTLSRSGDRFAVSPNPLNPSGPPLLLGSATRPVVLMLDADCVGCNPVRLSSTGYRYSRGRIRFRLEGNNSIRAIATNLTMDEYLYGLGEVPSSWPEAALEAQAIAGRSYARNKVNRSGRSGRTFDLFSSTYDQVYIGWDKEGGRNGSRWRAAVDATANQTVNYAGRAIEALYSSSTGGHTEDSGFVFVNQLPYLRGVVDPRDGGDNPFATWSRTFSQEQMTRYMNRSSDTRVGTVNDIRIVGTTGVSGRVDKTDVTISGSDGSKTVSGGRLRRAINAGIADEGGGLSRQILSTKFTIGVSGGDGDRRDSQPRAGTPDNPAPNSGVINVVRQGKDGTVVRGWAIDGDKARAAVDISVFNERVAVARTGFKRLDIQRRLGGNGRSGWKKIIPTQPPGTSVCVSLRNTTNGGNTFLGCRTVK